jgi:hypothetical protein
MNRPLFVRGQNRVSLGLTLSREQRSVAVPVLSRLSRSTYRRPAAAGPATDFCAVRYPLFLEPEARKIRAD